MKKLTVTEARTLVRMADAGIKWERSYIDSLRGCRQPRDDRARAFSQRLIVDFETLRDRLLEASKWVIGGK